MKRFALLALSIACASSPAVAADLGYYDEDVTVVRPAPRVIERERIVERYYAPAPREVIVEPREVYVEPRVYYEPRPYAYAGYGAYWRHSGYWRHHRRW